MLFSLYLSGQYETKYHNALAAKAFTEDDYKQIFEIEAAAKEKGSDLDAARTETEDEREEELNREYIRRDEAQAKKAKAAKRAAAKKLKE